MYGVLLAAKLANINEFKKNNIKITLVDKAKTILSTMRKKVINGYDVNNGFYGIEIPRGNVTSKIINNISEDILQKKNHLRLINLNGQLLKCMSKIENWPKSSKSDLNKIFNIDSINNLTPSELSSKAFQEMDKYMIGKLIKKSFYRYSNSIAESWGQFYPWFFPGEFRFTNLNDEGNKFYEDLKADKFIPYFLAPKSGIFEDIIEPLEKSLKNNQIELKLGSEFPLKQFKYQIDQNKLLIWATSSFNLLLSANEQFAKSLISSKRYHHLLLFKIDLKSLNKIIEKFDSLPSEILCIDEISLGSSRISFPENKQFELSNNKRLILLEYFSTSSSLEITEIVLAQKMLSNLFNTNIDFISKEFGRVVYILNNKKLEKAKNIVKKEAKELNLLIPHVFWGPINIAKCGLFAEDSAKEILQLIQNY